VTSAFKLFLNCSFALGLFFTSKCTETVGDLALRSPDSLAGFKGRPPGHGKDRKRNGGRDGGRIDNPNF